MTRSCAARLTPDYDFGCKRPTFSNSYYRTFTRPHVHLQDAGIARIESDGIVGVDGTKTRIDTLVLATGFDLWEANFPAIEVIGRDGRNLGKWWRETRFQAYQGVSMPYFPNYLSLASPYAFLGLNFFNTMEYQMRHMDRLFGAVKRRGATTFEITEDANARYLDRMTELLGDSLFTVGNCASARSYYFDPSGEPTLLRPMSTRDAITEASTFPVSDYQIVLVSGCAQRKFTCRHASPDWLSPAPGSRTSSPPLSRGPHQARVPDATPAGTSTSTARIETAVGLGIASAEDTAAGARRADRLPALLGRQRRAQPVAPQQRHIHQTLHDLPGLLGVRVPHQAAQVDHQGHRGVHGEARLRRRPVRPDRDDQFDPRFHRGALQVAQDVLVGR